MTALRIRDLHGRYRPAIAEPGIYDVPADLYHADPCAEPSIGAGGLHTLITDCPALYWHASALNPLRPAFDTKAYLFGRAAHLLLLEPQRFFAGVKILPHGFRANSDAGKAVLGAARRVGQMVLKMAEFEVLVAMKTAVMAHDFAGMAFLDGQPERTLVWRDTETGVLLRCRPDFLPANGRHIPDYKTAASARPDRFVRDAYAFGYHMRAAHYLDGIAAVTGTAPDSYFFVVQEKTPPYLVTCVTLDSAAIDWGRIQNRKAIHLFADCLAADRWPGYADEVV
ncbi:MAG: PD-(D/E)XK nuclease-like domain-containing protein, partial [Gammaproteobacteria bacterium]|nr:PD-(D/E)XK nuclease-like domain-containing protein [Gammaproteobacteria bacterium]